MEITKVIDLPADIQALVTGSLTEGFLFLQRLVDDFEDGSNSFDCAGEVLMTARLKGNLVAIGGINIGAGNAARLRRFYVCRSCRKKSVSRKLLNELENYAAVFIKDIELYSDTSSASKFYESCGYIAVHENKVSHRIILPLQK